MEEQSKYVAGVYCRLSNDDDNKETSASIETQKQICTDYCRENGIQIFDCFIDDGWSGTNFRRPGFQRLIECIEAKKINVVIVKDLSRFGREYLETGAYITQYFPAQSVRFIAISDSIDSLDGCIDYNWIFPIKNLFNEFYPADCSKKVRQALSSKVRNGEYIGSFAPYGYKKSAADKHILEIDPVTAPTVKRIFEMLAYQGCGFNKIARTLSAEKVIKPEAYQRLCASKPYENDPYDWNLGTIRAIAGNKAYVGTLISGKRRKQSFKSKRIVKQSEDKWTVIENVIPPLISQNLWEAARKAVASRKRETTSGFDNIFAGIIKCADCGYALGLSNGNGRDAYYICEQYKKKGRDRCTAHYLKYDTLYDAVLRDLQKVWAEIRKDKKTFVARVLGKYGKCQAQKVDAIRVQIESYERRLTELDKCFKKIYEDWCVGKLSERNFSMLSKQCESEQEEIEKKKAELETELSALKENHFDSDAFLALAEEYADIPKLDREVLHKLIETISVGEERDGKSVRTTIRIRYRFIGEMN